MDRLVARQKKKKKLKISRNEVLQVLNIISLSTMTNYIIILTQSHNTSEMNTAIYDK